MRQHALRPVSARRAGPALVLVLALLPLASERAGDEPSRERMRAVQQEIERLETELEQLGTRESGVLGELAQIEAGIRLLRAQSERSELELAEIGAAIDERTERLGALEREQARRARYLAFRLREIYKDGPHQALRRAVEGRRLSGYVAARRYAAQLSQRDARVLADYRSAVAQLGQERQALAARQEELDGARREAEAAAARLAAQRSARERMLASIRDDRSSRATALGELEAAAEALDRLASSLAGSGLEAPRLDVRKFRGLLDWPAAGAVSAGFGERLHPRFRTKLPHPGLDIDAREGTDIRTVFDGVVVFASWMRGYGLTAIVDHGQGMLSIYAHASVLLVEPGEEVLRGATLGKVGDSGSLRGPFLYLELRQDGTPVDPLRWLRPR